MVNTTATANTKTKGHGENSSFRLLAGGGIVIWSLSSWLSFPVDEPFPYLEQCLILIIGLGLVLSCLSSAVYRTFRRATICIGFVGGVVGALVFTWATFKVRNLTPISTGQSLAFSLTTVAMEDGNFYQHSGFDWVAIHNAVRLNVRKGKTVIGGSTITQQLAKNCFLGYARTLSRKLPEAFLARALEQRFSKRELLDQYVAVIDYGMGQRGIQKAAQFYFHTTPEKLTLAQSAVLVGIVPYNPRKWPSQARLDQGRRTALNRLAFYFPGKFSETELEAARNAPLQKLLPDWSGRDQLY